MTSKVYSKQIGGSHYKDMAMQPSEFINKNKLQFAEGNAIKYICRHAHKGEVEDLEKAKHYIDMIIERDYGPQENWIDGYNKWKELSEKGVVNNKVKLKDIRSLNETANTIKGAKKSAAKQDEEYRVWYVGITRTMKNLYLIKSQNKAKEFKI